eukprot:comp23183_c0_seq1/m.37572 comp23183_c0_seq1/g.37572  ORF comp23183_c0_seq1/g.37572 comp23183_c0_seq1/m.37572 type:complete len:812 (-) comp23183_c0_seq1:190-2625(-)
MDRSSAAKGLSAPVVANMSHQNSKDAKTSSGSKPSSGNNSRTVSRNASQVNLNCNSFLSVSIVQARNLKAADWNGKSDPFFVVTCGGTEYKSKVVKKTVTPVWNERADFGFEGESIPPFTLRVYDWDMAGQNEFLGQVEYTVTEKDYAELPPYQWVTLQKAKKGEIQLQVAAQKRGATAAASMQLESTRWVGLTTITIERGLKFVRPASSGKLKFPGDSRLCVIVEYGTTAHRSKAVAGTDPVWRQQVRFWVTDADEKRILRFSVYDGDTLLGRGYLGLQDFINAEELSKRVCIVIHEEEAVLSDKSSNSLKEAAAKGSLNIIEMSDVDKTASEELAAAKPPGSPAPERVPVHHSEMEGSGPVIGQLHVTVDYAPRHTVEKWFFKRLLDEFDTNNDGTLEPAEMKAAFEAIDYPMSMQDVENLFKRMDLNGDGVLEEQELVQYLCSAEFQSRPLSYTLLAFLANGKLGLDSLINDTYSTVDSFRSAEGNQVLSVTDGEKQMIGKLMIYDRVTGLIVEEFIPKYIKIALNLMYDVSIVKGITTFRGMNRVLRSMSQKEGAKMDNPASKKKIPDFIATHNLNMAEVLDPLEAFPHFNAFFYRKLKPDARPITALDDPTVVVSPADCRMTVFPTIMDATTLWIKGSEFTIDGLLGPRAAELAPQFYGGSLCIARLAPQDYHRWHSPVTGTLGLRTPISGELYTVNPVAVRQPLNVYTENKREVCEIHTDAFGLVVMIAVGATMVGSIVITAKDGTKITKGDEHGYFAFGGSTILLLFRPGTVQFDADLVENSRKPLETLVKVGMKIGQATRRHA